MSHSAPTPAAVFDAQALAFDGRAGLPPRVRAAIADAVVEMGNLDCGARLLDLGAGTGEIGLELLARSLSYRGVDASSGMLDVFRARAEALNLDPDLVLADAGARWPAEDASVRVVFGSRSLHWIDSDHLVAELRRVASCGGLTLLIGRVARDRDDPRERIRAEMRARLRDAGFEGRNGGGTARESIAECVRQGGRAVPPRVVASWPVSRVPRASLADWRGKPGLAGRDVPESVKAEVLSQVERFTTEAFGHIDAPVPVTEHYVLEGAEMGPNHEK